MVKTEATDPLLARVNWQASNFPWCSGYSPIRFRHGLDLLIHKRLNSNCIDSLRPNFLFDIEANMHNKRLGKDAMNRAENCGSIAPEQFESKKEKSADLLALNTQLYYNHLLLQRNPAISVFINLVSNYDLMVYNIVSLALQQVGTPQAAVFCTFTTLQDMVHTVHTAYGDSLETYSGKLWVIKIKPLQQ
eukprot:7368025-Ditylum_brightwellii.AAC.1